KPPYLETLHATSLQWKSIPINFYMMSIRNFPPDYFLIIPSKTQGFTLCYVGSPFQGFDAGCHGLEGLRIHKPTSNLQIVLPFFGLPFPSPERAAQHSAG